MMAVAQAVNMPANYIRFPDAWRARPSGRPRLSGLYESDTLRLWAAREWWSPRRSNSSQCIRFAGPSCRQWLSGSASESGSKY